MTRRLPLVALLLILLVAAFFRFDGLHWDAAVREVEGQPPVLEEQHLHPDERFLTMVTSSLEFPPVSEYFDTDISTLNPHNRGHGFFAYGTLPLFMVRMVAGWFDAAGYDRIHIIGRLMSAASGLATVLLLFVFGRRLYGTGVGLLAAFLYSVAALPIQQAHFYTVDEFTNPFVMLALIAAVIVQERGSRLAYLVFGAALGAAMACKMPVFTMALVLVAAATSHFAASSQAAQSGAPTWPRARSTMLWLSIAGAVAFVVFRVFQPYAFAGPGFFGLSISQAWWANMQEVRELVSGARDFPPGHQWADRPAIWFPWKNMVTVGLGPALGLAGWAGWAWAGWELWRRERRHLVPWLWVTIVFLHQGTQWVKSLRYLLTIYPMIALFAGWLVVRLWRRAATGDPAAPSHRWQRRIAAITGAVVILGSFAWAWAFTSIYRRPHSRIAASRWMYANIEPGSKIGVEVWDDPLPLRIDGKDAFSIYGGVEVHGYMEDDPRKLDHLITALDQVDVLSLSSNRLYDSIPRLPMRYPIMTRYYRMLFSGELGFRRVAEFTSYPRLFGIDFPDQGAEEAWSVYDHPRVQLFEKTADWDAEKARRLLGDGIDWAGIQKLWPRDIAGYKPLIMEPSLAQAQSAGGTWSRTAGGMFASDGLAARLPALPWVLALLLLGAIGFPLTFVALPGLADRGFLVARGVGLLAVAYLAWLLASLRWVAFTRGGVALAAALVLAVALAAAWSSRRELRSFLAERWRLLLVEEVVFWSFFAVLLAIRAANPDLWHAARGGEKPMDLAYLTAITKSTYFPPYDPWFAGGYLNYYYFGFVLTAALIKLTGVVPGVAYNLAVPTFYALMAGGAFTAAAALASRLRHAFAPSRAIDAGVVDAPAQPPPPQPGMGQGSTWRSTGALLFPGLLGAIFVAVTGNLYEIRLIWRGFRELGGGAAATGFRAIQSAMKGIGAWAGGQRFAFPDDWWFWSASRAIEHPAGEAPPITEFPFFTFLFADLHAHLMALPVALLVLVVLVAMVVDERPAAATSTAAGSQHRSVRGRAIVFCRAELPALVLLGLAVGALWPINAWDFPTYLTLSGIGLLVVEARRHGAWSGTVVAGALGRLALVAILARLFFLPFSNHFATAYNKPQLWEGSRTLFVDFLTVHGLFLFFLASYLLTRLRVWSAAGELVRAARARRRWRSRRDVLRRRLVRFVDVRRRVVAPAGLAVIGIGVVLALCGLTVEGLLVAVLAAAAIDAFAAPHRDAAARFLAGMVALAAGLALTVEHLVLSGDIARMNTVFKSYLQIWSLWGVAAAAAAAALWARRPRGKVWVGVGMTLFAAVLLYPILATPARIRDRFDLAAPTGLDGERYLDLAVFHEATAKIPLRDDAEAFAWLQRSVVGSPVVLEASVPPYRWGSRVSQYTGLPTVIGWDWHQRQQRSVRRDDSVGRRLEAVKTIYGTVDLDEAMALLEQYHVEYVYLGQVERMYYAGPGLEKFESASARGLTEVFRNASVRIYRVGDDARLSSR